MRFPVVSIGIVLLANTALTTFALAQDRGAPTSDLPALLKGEPAKADPKDDDLRKLLKERYKEAVSELAARYEIARAGAGAPDALFEAMKRVVHAGLELYEDAPDRVALLEKYAAFTKVVEKIVKAKIDTGLGATPGDLHQAKYYRADAEIQLLRAKAKAKDNKK